MFRAAEKGLAGVLAALNVLLLSSCAVSGVKQHDDFVEKNGASDGEADGSVRPKEETSDAGVDVACTRDSDGDGASDCADACPLDPRSTAMVAWYSDCDGDGDASVSPHWVCGSASDSEACLDGAAPDGGWSDKAGTDCDDEDAATTQPRDFYPDCDGDGKPSTAATRACGLRAVSAAFDCEDGQDPDGGFWIVPGTDCADEDKSQHEPSDWFPDCDADGAATSFAIRACGIRAASELFACADGKAPDGGFWSMPGIDCNDENNALVKVSDWYADCDGDKVASSVAIRACGVEGAREAFDCGDGQDPDGGFATTKGSDCNDEDGAAAANSDWYADCDGDKAESNVAIRACGIAGARAAFDCKDGQDPDGGFASAKGNDCNDEDGAAAKQSDWFADCDGDAVASSVATRACGLAGARAAFDCKDGQDPDGGFATLKGSDCNDEDGAAVKQSQWFADCDGDGVHRATAIQACGLASASASSPCLDGLPPDGGFDVVAGDDCNDELSENPCACGFQDDDGDSVCMPAPLPKSCLEVLGRNPLAADGTYELDPDGLSSTPSLFVRCDMTGGGFTEISREDFELGASGWVDASGNATPVDTACRAAYSAILGGVNILGNGAETKKTFSLLGIPHTQVSVMLDYVVIDSWDGEYGQVFVDGVERHSAPYLLNNAPTNHCGGGWADLGSQAVRVTTDHSQDSVTVRVTSTLDQPANDESFGVDNVVIRIR